MSSKRKTRHRSHSREDAREDDRRRRKHNYSNERESDEHGSSRSTRNDRRDSDSRRRDASPEDRRREESEENFSFGKYKHELNKIFAANPNLVHDVADFWRFVEKYESVRRQLGDGGESAVDEASPALNSIGVPSKYHKSHCINFKLGLSYGELFARVPEMKQLTKSRLLKLRDVIVLYLDFKQKEKFGKLKKLRNMQANLPVARFKEEIIETVKREKVVIIAGDTGCGKSTQIPQYLCEANFQKIGKMILE